LENTRIISFLLLLLTITIAGIRVWNSSANIESEWNYILQAVDSLEIANETSLELERKQFYIQEAIGLYRKGPNLIWLQMLSRQNSSIDIDYFIPKAIIDLKEERATAINLVIHAPRALAVTLFIAVLAVTTFVGTFAKGKYVYSKWSIDSQHTYIAIIVISFLVLFVGSLP